MLIPEFNHLNTFINNKDSGNCFYPVDINEILKTERRLKFLLPSQIRTFYREIGYGFFQAPIRSPNDRHDLINRIISPHEIADFMLGESSYPPTIPLRKGHMPFFDIGESDYLIFKHESDEPNRVYWFDGRTVVASDFVEFIKNLSINPSFYLSTK